MRVTGSNDGFSTEVKLSQDTKPSSEVSALDKQTLVLEKYSEGCGILLPDGVFIEAKED